MKPLGAATIVLLGIVLLQSAVPIDAAQSDLDAFMQRVLERRDDNWKKLQQYILDEREQIELRGPARTLLWGERRDFTWYVRDGYFVRSPVRVNGVTIGEDDRVEYEASYLKRVQRRDQRAAAQTPPANTPPAAEETATDVAGLIRQSRQPEFISSAYFLRFRFDEGTYALVGRERLEDRDVLRIEYYPTNLFQRGRNDSNENNQQEALLRRLMNKVALVTLWIEPTAHQIVKMTYDNITFEFLPVPWLARVDDVRASMTMGQAFPDVWLPRALEMNASLTLAVGTVDFRYALDYTDYRQAEATIRVR
ncbi:MAG TPA: hypothetical protein VM818_20830 [Vicinamibacterales bacterium]|nr:hypothetical protein [Vicinamibacterales bacterium]